METGIQKVHALRRRDQRGITGLETAIVLIAFVVVASVFAYAVITTGLFSSEQAQTSAQSGVEAAKSTMSPKGSMILSEAQSVGTHDTGASSADLEDVANGAFIVEGVVVGDTVHNVTDGSSCTIPAVSATTTHAVLAGAAWLVIAHAIRLAVPRLAVYASTLLGFSYVPLLSVGVLLSEEPLLLLVAAVALWFADRRDDRKSSAFLAGTFAGLAALTAQWGVIMIPAVAIGFATRRQWQSSGVCFGVALLVVLVGRMVFWGAVVGWAGSEIAVTDLATVSGLQSDATVTSQLFNALPGRSVFLAVVPAVALAVWGAVSIAREAPTLVSVFALVVAGIPLCFYAIQWVALPWFFLLCSVGAVRLRGSRPRLSVHRG